MHRGMIYCIPSVLEAFISLGCVYLICILCSIHFMCIHFPQVDKPKQNGSADGDDALQGSKQGEHTVFVFVASWYQITHNSS